VRSGSPDRVGHASKIGAGLSEVGFRTRLLRSRDIATCRLLHQHADNARDSTKLYECSEKIEDDMNSPLQSGQPGKGGDVSPWGKQRGHVSKSDSSAKLPIRPPCDLHNVPIF
jgi:hypothetical protein